MRTNVPSVRTLVLIFCLSLFSSQSFSQSITSGNGKFEIGLGIGPMFFLGDLGGNYGEGKTFVKDVNFPLTKVSKGLYANLYPVEWFGFRLAINQGILEGNDGLVKDKGGDEFFRKKRNLQFRSSVLEAYVAAEVYPTVFLEQFSGYESRFKPYGLIGVGALKFNPKGEYTDQNGLNHWVALQPLRLEGQGMSEYAGRAPYKLTSMEIPMGFGAKYYIKENMYVGMEVLHRKTFTDYIDDVSTTYIDRNLFDKYLPADQAVIAKQLHFREQSTLTRPVTRNINGEQRGDPRENDSYFSTILRFGWKLNDPNSFNSRAARQMRCPSFY